MTDTLRKYILLNLPYALIFWFSTKVGEAYRLAEGADFLKKLVYSVNTLGPAMASPLPTLHPFDLAVGAGGTAIIYVLLYFKKKNAKKWRKDVEHGSARWGTPEDIRPYVDPKPENNILLTQTEGLTMNSRPKNPKHARNKNILVVGGSGSGKTRFFVKPQLMQMHSSYLVTDPKGQVLIECGRLLERNGYKIKVVNTINFAKSMRYNPFHYIHSEKDILKLVNVLIANTNGDKKGGGDPFWEKSEILLYCALIGLIHYRAPEEERNMNSLVELINAMEIREDDESFRNPVDFMFEHLAEEEPQHFAVRQYAKFKLAAGKTARSILISCGARLAVFDIKEVREMLAYDELELDLMGDRKTALFIITSDTDNTFDFITAMICSQLFNILCTKADDVYNGRLPIHVRCLLDEFANVKIPNMERLISVFRSREISAALIIQAQSQLKGIYDKHADTITANCDSMLFLGGKEKGTLEELNKLLGRETIDTYNNSETKGNSPSFGKNFSKLGKDLMSMDEIAVMDGGKCILQLRGVRPFLSDKYDITQHKNYRYLSDYNEKNAFNIQRYLSTRLSLRPEDEFEVYDVELPEEAMDSESH
ncbi:type IV secretory system conjugative DNA transfer family protein [Ruminococcaceae bacterium OttesenSCG-928-L11]|nr:type IV secretory system conjugative DNA transfer family protein [Ruminococcaceae bacterium OttesenSCG-928-L11]